MNFETTIDGLLNKRVMLEQPKDGYRVAVDTVLLAAAVSAQPGARVLDTGCGVGGAMLCLAARVEGAFVTGIEIQEDLAHLCASNISRNAMEDRLDVYQGDATQLPQDFWGRFDHVMMNPPYHDEARHDVSGDPGKRLANTERTGDLPFWVANAARALKPGGVLTLIHRFDRLDDIAGCLKSEFGALLIKPVAPKLCAAPKRVLLRASKGAVFSRNETPGFVLHEAGGRYTEETEGVLRDALGIDFS